MINKARDFFRGVIAETKKVTWPGRQALIGSTVVVIILVLLIAVYIGLVDFLLSRMLNVVVQ